MLGITRALKNGQRGIMTQAFTNIKQVSEEYDRVS